MNKKFDGHPEQRKNGAKRTERRPTLLIWLLKASWVVLAFFVYFGWIRFGTPVESWGVFLGVSAFVAAVMAGQAAYGQLAVMREQLNTAHEAERPWVTFHDLDVTATSGSDPLDATITAINAGRSPARIDAWTRDFAFVSAPPPPPLRVEKPIHPEPSEGSHSGHDGRILVPGMEMKTDIYVYPPPRAPLGTVLHVFSQVTYADLRSGKRHITKVCWRYFIGAQKSGHEYCQEYAEAT